MPKSQKPRKSHHGCSACKRRSVKCDEKRPRCSNCEHRRTACHYATAGPWLWSKTHGSTTDETAAQEPGQPSPCVNEPVTRDTSHEALTSMGQFNTQHLRLLLTWTTSTCHSISRNRADAQVWQEVIPQRALSCPSLLHGMFAVSALHLALTGSYQGPEQQALIEDAETHQSEATKMIMEMDNQSESSKLFESFALSSILVGFAFAFPLALATRCQAQHSALDELVEVFVLIRTMMNFSSPAIGRIQMTELRGMFLVEDGHSSPSKSSQQAIAALHELVRTDCSVRHENHQVFIDTIDCLEKLLSKLDGTEEIVSGSFNWVCEVPAVFIDLLQERSPTALVILAHYCVVLHHLRDRWWISSWGERVLDVIVEILGPACMPSLSWAFNAIKT